MNEEIFDIVDEEGKVIGQAPRNKCHGDPSLIHRTVHVIVYHPDGRILLQKRSLNKDIQPGKWDTAVGGHLDLGEDFSQAVLRELYEELGVLTGLQSLKHIADLKIRNEIESENIRVYSMIHSGPFDFQKDEIDELKFWEINELRQAVLSTSSIFTPNLIVELKKLEII